MSMTVQQATVEKMIHHIEGIVDRIDNGMGALRRADVRTRIRYIVENADRIFGRPASPSDAFDIAHTAIAHSYAAEIGHAISWECKLAVQIAHAILEDVNCHTEAAALRQAAEKMGGWN